MGTLPQRTGIQANFFFAPSDKENMIDSAILKRKVLLMDDMITLREALQSTLKKIGFVDITTAADGLQGLERAVEVANSGQPFELIFSDIMMPKCTGIEFLRKVRAVEAYKGTPIIMITSESELTTVLEAVEAGASSYILKPFNAKIIEQKIAEVFKKRAAAQK